MLFYIFVLVLGAILTGSNDFAFWPQEPDSSNSVPALQTRIEESFPAGAGLHVIVVSVYPRAVQDRTHAAIAGFLRRLLDSTTRSVTLHLLTNSWEGLSTAAERLKAAEAALFRDSRLTLELYQHCAFVVNATTGLSTCPDAGTPLLNGAAAYTHMIGSFFEQWPRHDSVHPDTNSYLIKPFAHRWIRADVNVALVLDLDVEIGADVAGLVTEALPAMRRAGALVALTPEMQDTYEREWDPAAGCNQRRFTAPPDEPPLPPRTSTVIGYNGGVQVLDLAAMRASTRYNAFLDAFDWNSAALARYACADCILQHLGDQTVYTLLDLPGLVDAVTSAPKAGSGGLSAVTVRTAASSATGPFVHRLSCVWNNQLCPALRKSLPLTSERELRYMCPYATRLLHSNCKVSGVNLANVHEVIEILAINRSQFKATVEAILGDPSTAPWAKTAAASLKADQVRWAQLK
jgi:hypothetical protein